MNAQPALMEYLVSSPQRYIAAAQWGISNTRHKTRRVDEMARLNCLMVREEARKEDTRKFIYTASR